MTRFLFRDFEIIFVLGFNLYLILINQLILTGRLRRLSDWISICQQVLNTSFSRLHYLSFWITGLQLDLIDMSIVLIKLAHFFLKQLLIKGFTKCRILNQIFWCFKEFSIYFGRFWLFVPCLIYLCNWTCYLKPLVQINICFIMLVLLPLLLCFLIGSPSPKSD